MGYSVAANRQSKRDRQCNGQMKKVKRKWSTKQKTKDLATRTQLKPGIQIQVPRKGM